MTVTRPKQRIPASQKTKDWQKENGDYWSSVCSRGIDTDKSSFLYKVASGRLEASDYMYVVNPQNTRRKELQGYPAKVRNMDIISPILMVMLGEKGKRYINSQVIAQNSDIQSKKKEYEAEEVLNVLKMDYRNEAQLEGIDVGQPLDEKGNPTQQPKSMEKIQEETETLQDDLSIQGQDSLDYIMWYNKIPTEFRDGFYNFLVTNWVCSYKRVWKDDVEVKMVSPHEIKYLHKTGLRFLEDAPAIKRITRMNINEVFDNFTGVKGFEAVSKLLEERITNASGTRRDYNTITGMGTIARETMWKNLFGDTSYHSAEDILVEHVIWTGQHKVGIVTVPDIDGTLVEHEVDEDYLPTKYESVDWDWRDQKMEIYIIDGEHYVGYRPLPITRAPAGKPQKCKNPYNGRAFNSMVVDNKSIVEKGYPYQMKHNVMHYHLERVIAKNLDKLLILPTSLIGDKHDEKSLLYYAQANGILWVDPSDKNAIAHLNAIKILDASLNQYISQMSGFLEYNKSEWENSVGVNRQRRGESDSSQGKGTMEESIYRGTIMTEEIFVEYDEYQESDLQGCLDLSSFAFSEGKKAHYVRSDGSRAFLDVNPEQIVHGDYLVHVSSSGTDKENLDMFKSQSMAFAQNQATPSQVAKILKGNNMEKLIKEMEKMEQSLQESQAAAAQAEQAEKQADREHEEKLLLMTLQQKEADSKRKAEVASSGDAGAFTEFGGFETASSTGSVTEPDSTGLTEETKRMKIASDERQNKEDNKTKLKNPVSGEGKQKK
ncbi:hypothetical protein LCGC14_0245440 [marine sediment metagenome]|uniref:Portal protein n=1 Tax=marine sediment metagenome TaxID=412755 RepID=A0A0F9XAG4_9ZZZZ